MAQAVKLTEATVGIVATKIGQTPADVRAMLQTAEDRNYDSYIVFDYYGPRGDYVPWSQMREVFFKNYFDWAWGEDPNKFEAVVAKEMNPED